MKNLKTFFLVIAIIAGLNLVVSVVYAETGYFDFIQNIIPIGKILTWGMLVPFVFLMIFFLGYVIIRQKEKEKKI